MSDQLAEMQANIVGAVQSELTRFSQEVAGEVAKVREELTAGAVARTELEQQVRALAAALEKSHAQNAAFQGEIQKALEQRLNEFSEATKRRHDEMNTRLGRVVDEANVGIAATVESAARPIIKDVEHRQGKVEADVQALGANLQKFDEQAARMVGHINEVTAAVENRLEQINRELMSGFDERHASLVMRIDEVSAAAARQQAEVANIVGDRVDASEARTSEKIVGLENRMNEEIGQKVADIDAHVGRVSMGLDEAVGTLSDRISAADEKFADVAAEFAKVREDISNVDAEAIEEIKEKIGSALGQAELVRIEMDRFKEEIQKKTERTNVRLTELETTVQDQYLDVETSIQLERLEEIERAMLLLDPDQFIRRDEVEDLGDIGVAGGMTPINGTGDPLDVSGTTDAYETADPDATRAMPVLDGIDGLDGLDASSPLAPPSADPDSTDGTSPSATLQPPVGS